MTGPNCAIGLLVACSLAIGLGSVLPRIPPWIPIALGLLGAGALLHASLLLIREARSAVASTLQELEALERVVTHKDS